MTSIKANIIPLDNNKEIMYPVGQHITHAIRFIDSLFDKFKDIYLGCGQITLWVRGSSGAILGALFSQKVNQYFNGNCIIKINHIKKPTEYSHTNNSFIYYEDNLNIILDDFISSGKTLEAIIEAINDCSYTDIDYTKFILIVYRINNIQDLSHLPIFNFHSIFVREFDLYLFNQDLM